MLQIAPASVEALQIDIRDEALLRKLLNDHDIDSVIHLAGLKAVGESVNRPARRSSAKEPVGRGAVT